MPVIKEEPMDELIVQENAIEERMETDSGNTALTNIFCDDLLYLILKGFENEKVSISKLV